MLEPCEPLKSVMLEQGASQTEKFSQMYFVWNIATAEALFGDADDISSEEEKGNADKEDSDNERDRIRSRSRSEERDDVRRRGSDDDEEREKPDVSDLYSIYKITVVYYFNQPKSTTHQINLKLYAIFTIFNLLL